jgi:methylmalonyl-CoA mutase C-terminal domain/subunit
MTLFPRVVQLLAEEGITDVVVFGGGIIPDDDLAELKEAGLAGIFTPGTPLSEITDWVAQNVEEH